MWRAALELTRATTPPAHNPASNGVITGLRSQRNAGQAIQPAYPLYGAGTMAFKSRV
jgi:hypothetical protein